MPSHTKKGKYFCFTSYDDCWEYEPIEQLLTFVVWQLEKCPKTEREHCQGYLETKNSLTWKEAKENIFKNNEHFDFRLGNQEQAINYCKKLETRIDGPWEWGTPVKQGQRSDLISIKEMITNNKSDLEIAQEHFGSYIRYHKGFEKFRELLQTERSIKPTVIIHWGPAGRGKTKAVYDLHNSIYNKPDGKWWNGYSQQEVILLDDFDPHAWSREHLLKLLDRYPMIVEKKGGFTNINSKFIYITCNYNPEHWGIWDEALKRRIDKIVAFE